MLYIKLHRFLMAISKCTFAVTRCIEYYVKYVSCHSVKINK